MLYEPAFAVSNNWFRRDRGRAMLTMTVIAGFSATIFIPLVQGLVDALTWRGALVVLAAIVGGCAFPHALVLRRAPHDLGLEPDGDAEQQVPVRASSTPSGPRSWHRAVVRRLTTSAVLHTIAVTVMAVHLVGFLRADGVDAQVAALSAGSLGVMSVSGRVVFTSLAARVGIAQVAGVLVAGQAAGVMALLVVPGATGVVVFVVLFGFGSGVMTIARPALLGEHVPSSRFAATSGHQTMISTVGRVVAPVAAGLVITAAGYVPALIAVAISCVAAGVVLLALEHPSPCAGPSAADLSHDMTVPGRTDRQGE